MTNGALPSTDGPVWPQNAVEVVVDLRFEDMDALGHVNNVTMLRLMEEAKVRFGETLPEHGSWVTVVVRHEVEYRAELVAAPGSKAVFQLWATKLGSSSFELAWLLLDRQNAVKAMGTSSLVVVDPQTHAVEKIPDQARAALQEILGAPPPFRGR